MIPLGWEGEIYRIGCKVSGSIISSIPSAWRRVYRQTNNAFINAIFIMLRCLKWDMEDSSSYRTLASICTGNDDENAKAAGKNCRREVWKITSASSSRSCRYTLSSTLNSKSRLRHKKQIRSIMIVILWMLLEYKTKNGPSATDDMTVGAYISKFPIVSARA